jgi:outer membrane protein TolC
LNACTKNIWILAVILFSAVLCQGQEQTLDYYIQSGLTNSPVLKDISGQIRENSADSLISQAGYRPQVSFNGYMMYAPVISGYGYSEVITNGQNLTGTVNVTQDIFNKKTRETEYEKFGIRNQSLANTQKLSKNELQKIITVQYLTACSACLEESFEKEILATLRTEEQVLGKLVDAGLYRPTDYLLFRLELSNLDRRVKELGIQFKKELSTLNILCGIPDTTRYTLRLPELTELLPSGSTKSPLFLRFEIDSLRIENEKAIINRKYKPAFSWFTDAGLVNDQPRYIYQNFGLSLGMSMSFPIYDGNQRKLNFSKLKTSEESRKNFENQFRLQYDLQLSQLKEELEKTRQIIQDNEEQINLAKTLIEQDKILLNYGSVPITEYMIAMKNLLESRQTGIRYKVRALQIINELNFWKK